MNAACKFVNISSTLGRVPIVSFRSAYSAAKHALNALTANLRMDLRDGYPDIAVSLVLPGPVATEFAEKAVGTGTAPRMDMAPPQTQTADEVAGVIADVIERPCAEVYTMPGHAEFAARYYQDVAAAEAQMAQMMRGGRR